MLNPYPINQLDKTMSFRENNLEIVTNKNASLCVRMYDTTNHNSVSRGNQVNGVVKCNTLGIKLPFVAQFIATTGRYDSKK